MLTLRPVVPSDLPILYAQQCDPDAAQMAAFPMRDYEPFMTHWHKILRNPDGLIRAIEVDGHVVGNIAAYSQDNMREVGYWLGREYWGKGIGTQALREFLAIEQTRPLYAHVAKHNIGSLRVLQKCGFAIEGEEAIAADEKSEAFIEVLLKLA